MPASTDGANRVERAGETLRFTGALLRSSVAPLWPQVLAQLDGVRRLDLTAVERVDSAGLALLAELAERLDAVALDGAPAGLTELRAAYRLTPQLRFAAGS
ncbi:MAG: STAS domain-containing protein [Gammaproteobacteria bacterium]|nr:STAS domain-containing protein [Gammaproteobacteria bacterium]